VAGLAVSLVATGTVPFGVPFGIGKASPATSPDLPPGGGIPPAGLRPAPPADGLSAQQAAGDILWTHSTVATAPAGDALVPVFGLGTLDYSTDPGIARTLPSCPAVTVTRGAVIDGVGAIKLTDSKHGGTLWINAVTYLPIESVLPYPAGASSPLSSGPLWSLAPSTGKAAGSVTTRYGYLAQATGDILWVHTTTQASHASDTVVDNTFSYRTASRHLTYTPSGQPWDDDNTYVKPGPGEKSVSVNTVVLYDKRTVSVQTSPAAATSGPAAQHPGWLHPDAVPGLSALAREPGHHPARRRFPAFGSTSPGRSLGRLPGEGGDALHVVGHGEGVERAQAVQRPASVGQQLKVAGQGRRVAGDVAEPLGPRLRP
jgi:hypothetical protein